MKKLHHNPTTIIKSTFSNDVHNLIDTCQQHRRNTKEWYACRASQPKLTQEDKAKLFDKIVEMHDKSSQLLRNHFIDKRLKREIAKSRIERNYVPKKKTTKEEYEQLIKNK